MLFVSMNTKRKKQTRTSVLRKMEPQTRMPQTSSHSGPMWILFLCSARLLGLYLPVPWLRDFFSSAVMGGSGGHNSGAVLSGFKSKVMQQWLGDPGRVTSFPHLCNEGGDGT